MMNMIIEMDQEMIFLIEPKLNRVRKHCQLIDLDFIRIVDDNPNFNLILIFEGDIEIKLRMKTNEDRERIVSKIITLRSFLIAKIPGYVDRLKVLINVGLDIS